MKPCVLPAAFTTYTGQMKVDQRYKSHACPELHSCTEGWIVHHRGVCLCSKGNLKELQQPARGSVFREMCHERPRLVQRVRVRVTAVGAGARRTAPVGAPAVGRRRAHPAPRAGRMLLHRAVLAAVVTWVQDHAKLAAPARLHHTDRTLTCSRRQEEGDEHLRAGAAQTMNG